MSLEVGLRNKFRPIRPLERKNGLKKVQILNLKGLKEVNEFERPITKISKTLDNI